MPNPLPLRRSSFTFTQFPFIDDLSIWKQKLCAQRLRKRKKIRRRGKYTTKYIPEKKQSFRHFQIIPTPPNVATNYLSAPTNTQKLSECKALRGLENTSFSRIWNLLFHYTSLTPRADCAYDGNWIFTSIRATNDMYLCEEKK